jgi:hypothetical protein
LAKLHPLPDSCPCTRASIQHVVENIGRRAATTLLHHEAEHAVILNIMKDVIINQLVRERCWASVLYSIPVSTLIAQPYRPNKVVVDDVRRLIWTYPVGHIGYDVVIYLRRPLYSGVHALANIIGRRLLTWTTCYSSRSQSVGTVNHVVMNYVARCVSGNHNGVILIGAGARTTCCIVIPAVEI